MTQLKSSHRAFLLTLYTLCLLGCHCDQPNAPETSGSNIVWSYEIPEQYLDDVQPIIEQGKAYIASDTTVSCVELKSGTKIWKINFGNSSSFESRKLINGTNAVYMNDLDRIKAIEKQTGNVQWDIVIPNFVGSLAAMFKTETHLFISGDDAVVRVSLSSGLFDLRINVDSLKPAAVKQICASPCVSFGDNLLYVPTAYWNQAIGVTEGNLFCYNAQTGEYKWGYHLPARKIWLPALKDSIYSDAGSYGCDLIDSLVVFGSGHYLIALNRFNGVKVWESFIADGGFSMPPEIDAERVFIGSTNGNIYSYQLRTGSQLWSRNTRWAVNTIFTVSNGRLYSCNGEIWILNITTGAIEWRGLPSENKLDPLATYLSPLAVGEGYMVDVGSKKVYCLTIP